MAPVALCLAVCSSSAQAGSQFEHHFLFQDGILIIVSNVWNRGLVAQEPLRWLLALMAAMCAHLAGAPPSWMAAVAMTLVMLPSLF